MRHVADNSLVNPTKDQILCSKRASIAGLAARQARFSLDSLNALLCKLRQGGA